MDGHAASTNKRAAGLIWHSCWYETARGVQHSCQTWKMAAVTGALSCRLLLAWNSGVRLATITTGPNDMGICRIGLQPHAATQSEDSICIHVMLVALQTKESQGAIAGEQDREDMTGVQTFGHPQSLSCSGESPQWHTGRCCSGMTAALHMHKLLLHGSVHWKGSKDRELSRMENLRTHWS